MTKLWKAVENRVAKEVGGKRQGPVGKTGADVIGSDISVECKERKAFPKWLDKAMEQAESNNKPIQVAILHKKGGFYGDDLVVMRFRQFTRMLLDTRKEEDGKEVIL